MKIGPELRALVDAHMASLPPCALVLDDGADRGAAVRPALAMDRERLAYQHAEALRWVAWALVGAGVLAGLMWMAVG